MSNLDQLRHAVDLLQQAYDLAHAEMSESGMDPLQARTPDGRFVLLDALVTLVNARTALARAEAAELAVREAMVIQSGDSLLLRMERNLSRDEMDQYADVIAEPLKERLGLADVVLLGGIDGWAVKR